jgi:hypothetical protein
LELDARRLCRREIDHEALRLPAVVELAQEPEETQPLIWRLLPMAEL